MLDKEKRYHQILAEYFVTQPLFFDDVNKEQPNRHKCIEQPYQQTKGEMWDEVTDTLTDLWFVEAKVISGRTSELEDDYQEAITYLPKTLDEVAAEEQRVTRIKQYINDLIAYRRGELSSIKIIESELPKSAEEIETKRIINSPSRIDRINVFGNFVKSHAHLFAVVGKRPRVVTQIAYNHMQQGPVVNEAQKIIEADGRSPLFLHLENHRPPFNPYPSRVRVLVGHKDSILSVAVSADGAIAISGSDDKTLRVWDTKKGKCLCVLKGHTESVLSVALDQTGRIAVSGSNDTTLRVWDAKTGKCLRVFEGHIEGVSAVVLTADGQMAISGSKDKTLRVWDVSTGKCLHILEGHTQSVSSLAITADGRFVISGSGNRDIPIWDIQLGQCVGLLDGDYRVDAVAISGDGRTTLSLTNDDRIGIWQMATRKRLRRFDVYDPRGSVALSADGRIALISGYNTVQIWDVANGKLLQSTGGHRENVNAVAITPDGRTGISGGEDAAVCLWDIVSSCGSPQIYTRPYEIRKVAMSSDGNIAISTYEDSIDRHFSVWEVKDNRCLKQGKIRKTPGDDEIWLAISGDCQTIATAYALGNISIWDTSLNQQSREIKTRIYFPKAIALSYDGSKGIAIGSLYSSSGRIITIFNPKTGALLHEIEVESWYDIVALSPDGRVAITGGISEGFKVWDAMTGKNTSSVKSSFGNRVRGYIISYDGSRVVEHSNDGFARGWDLCNGEPVQDFIDLHTGCIAFSLDGRSLFTSAPNDSLSIFDVTTGTCIATLYCGITITAIDYSPQSGILALGGAGGEVLFGHIRNIPGLDGSDNAFIDTDRFN